MDVESYRDRSIAQGQSGFLRPSHIALGLSNDIQAMEQRNEFLESRNEMLTGMLMESKRAMLERSLNGNKATLIKDSFKAWHTCLDELKMERLLEQKTHENNEMQKAARELAQALHAEREGRAQLENRCWQLQDDCKRLATELQITRQRSDEQSQRIRVLEACVKDAESFISRRRQEVMDIAQEHNIFVDTLRQQKSKLERPDQDKLSDRAPSTGPLFGVHAENVMKALNQNGRADAARRQPSPELERPISGLSSPPAMGGMPPMTPTQEPPLLHDASIERGQPQGRSNWHQNSLDHAASSPTGLLANRHHETNSYMREVPTHQPPGSPMIPAPIILQPTVRPGTPSLPVRTGDSRLLVRPPTAAIPTGEPWWVTQCRAAGPIPGSSLHRVASATV